MRRSAQTAPDSSRRLRRNLLRIAAVLVVIAAGVPAAQAALAAEGVTATFTKSSDWGSGYEGKYTIHNGSSGPLTWRVEFDLPSGATISSFWDASLVQTGNHVVATGTWNATLAPGASTSFGWIGAPGGITPSNCSINGDPCTGGSGPSVPGAPTNLRVTGTSNNSISLAWNASSGTVTGYRVYEGSTQRAQVSGTSATISGLGA
ncbi:MAG TPA: cellulose binding domain-containing protein, partial [Micromonosporaceae bacterium]|nr:cellulose binding domain-containing protein [Micromonosporaceae bacterium]